MQSTKTLGAQTLADRLVQREVFCLADELVGSAMKGDDGLADSLQLGYRFGDMVENYDYENPNCPELAAELAEYYEEFETVVPASPEFVISWLLPQALAEFSAGNNGAVEHVIFSGLDIEPVYREVYQYYLVSEWLANKLATLNSLVVEHGNSYIYGRECYGQALSLDDNMQRIACELWGDEYNGTQYDSKA